MSDNNSQDYRFDYSLVKVFSGYYTDENLLKISSSGGAASIISEFIISRGGLVYGATYADDFKSAHYFCATTYEDLNRLKGSKYIITDKKVLIDGSLQSVYEAVAVKLIQGTEVLFVGLGCDIGALKKYLDSKCINSSNLYTIDLICHGPTYPEVQRQFLDSLENKYKSKVIDFSVRYKKEGWTPPYLYAHFENGKVFCKPFYETEFGYAFKILSKPSCFACAFKGNNHMSDITVGDFWGLPKESSRYNPNGVSIMFTHTAKGEFLIDSIDKNRFVINEEEPKQATDRNSMFYKSRDKDLGLDSFKKNFELRGLHFAVRHSSGYYAFIKRNFKKAVKRKLPDRIVKIIQAFMYKRG